MLVFQMQLLQMFTVLQIIRLFGKFQPFPGRQQVLQDLR